MPEPAAPHPMKPARIRVPYLQQMKDEGRRFSMLTSYDHLTARIFSEAGIEVLLIGDSLGNTVLGYDSTTRVELTDMELFTRAVSRGATRPLVVADMPFGSYEAGPADAVHSAVRLIKAGASAVKLEGGERVLPQVEALVGAGIPVMGHLGFTPQSVDSLGGFKVQGRDHQKAEAIANDAVALQGAGVFAIVLEMVPAPLACRITEVLSIPTIGIGAGADCDGQVLVWQDMAGLTDRTPRFVRTYANLGADLRAAAARYRDDVSSGAFPDAGHSFE